MRNNTTVDYNTKYDLSKLETMGASQLRDLVLNLKADLDYANQRYYSPAQLSVRYGDKSVSTIKSWIKRANLKTKKMIFDGDKQASLLIPHQEIIRLEEEHLHDTKDG